MNDNVTYSVVVPVYNSEDSLEELCARIIDTLSQLSFEIILVDDGSTDRSWQVIGQLKNKYPTVLRAIKLQKNYGQHAALMCAFSFCKSEFVVTIDDDLQYKPEDMLLLIAKQKELHADIVYGIIDKIKHSHIRNFGSKYVQFVSRLIDNNKTKGSSFRLLNKSLVQIIVENHINSFIFIDDILSWYTASFAFVEVAHYRRLSGKSGYNIIDLVKLVINKITNYSIFPLKAMAFLGFSFSVIFFLIGVRFIIRKMVYDVPAGYTSIIVTILFCSSIIMYCLGIIGQYLYKTYISHQNKPLYSIKQIF